MNFVRIIVRRVISFAVLNSTLRGNHRLHPPVWRLASEQGRSRSRLDTLKTVVTHRGAPTLPLLKRNLTDIRACLAPRRFVARSAHSSVRTLDPPAAPAELWETTGTAVCQSLSFRGDECLPFWPR
jgi:hypothetical protein